MQPEYMLYEFFSKQLYTLSFVVNGSISYRTPKMR